MQHKIGSKRIWTISGFHIPSEFFPQLPLILVIRIPCNANEPDTICIAQRSVKIPTIFSNGLLASGGFFDYQFATALLTYLFAVQFCGQHSFSGALVQVVNFLLGLRKGKAYLFFGKVNGVLIQCSNDRGYKTVGSGIAGFQLGAD